MCVFLVTCSVLYVLRCVSCPASVGLLPDQIQIIAANVISPVYAGDASSQFDNVGHSSTAADMLPSMCIGTVSAGGSKNRIRSAPTPTVNLHEELKE